MNGEIAEKGLEILAWSQWCTNLARREFGVLKESTSITWVILRVVPVKGSSQLILTCRVDKRDADFEPIASIFIVPLLQWLCPSFFLSFFLVHLHVAYALSLQRTDASPFTVLFFSSRLFPPVTSTISDRRYSSRLYTVAISASKPKFERKNASLEPIKIANASI